MFNIEKSNEKKTSLYNSRVLEKSTDNIDGGGEIILSKIDGARFFVSAALYERRNNNFLKGLRWKKVNSHFTIGYSLRQRFIYDIELKDKGTILTRDDFILLSYRKKGAGRGCDVFDQHKLG